SPSPSNPPVMNSHSRDAATIYAGIRLAGISRDGLVRGAWSLHGETTPGLHVLYRGADRQSLERVRVEGGEPDDLHGRGLSGRPRAWRRDDLVRPGQGRPPAALRH